MTEACRELHILAKGLKRMRFPFNDSDIPLNGVYILFENGEKAHGTDRIARVGTHTGKNQLRSRLKQHFIDENKDRSIFRKNIGRAILNRNKDSFLEKWELDLTTKASRERYAGSIDPQKQIMTEKSVTEYIQKNFSFVAFQIDDKEKRLEMESKIISSISKCDECGPSANWPGKFCPNEKLQSKRAYKNCLKLSKSGLWQVNELSKEPPSEEEMDELKELLS